MSHMFIPSLPTPKPAAGKRRKGEHYGTPVPEKGLDNLCHGKHCSGRARAEWHQSGLSPVHV